MSFSTLSSSSGALTKHQQSWLVPNPLYTIRRCAPSSNLPTNFPTHLRLLNSSATRIIESHSRGPTTSRNTITAAAAAAAAGTASNVKSSIESATRRGFAAVKARPFAHIATFTALHVSVAWALVPPIYLFFRNTNTANALLAGPSVSYILAKPVPSWIPNSLRQDGEQGTVESGAREATTVEDLLELQVRHFVGLLWKSGFNVYSTVSKVKNITAPKDGEEGAEMAKGLAKQAFEFLRGKTEGEEAASKMQAGEKTLKQQLEQSGEDTKNPGGIKGYFGEKARKNAGEIKLGQIRDAVAAYVVVKTLFPLRVPLSLFLTPKVVRLLSRLARRG